MRSSPWSTRKKARKEERKRKERREEESCDLNGLMVNHAGEQDGCQNPRHWKGVVWNKTDVSGRKSQLREKKEAPKRSGLGLGPKSKHFLVFLSLSTYYLSFKESLLVGTRTCSGIKSESYFTQPTFLSSTTPRQYFTRPSFFPIYIIQALSSSPARSPFPFLSATLRPNNKDSDSPCYQQDTGIFQHVAVIANPDQVCFSLLSLNAPDQDYSILMKTRLIFIACATFLRLARSQGHHGMEFGQFRIREPHKTTH